MRPVRFAEEVLGASLWSQQRDVLQAIDEHNRVTVRSGHGIGKTFVAACAALHFLIENAPSLVITTAPTFRQVEKVLWVEIGKMWPRCHDLLIGYEVKYGWGKGSLRGKQTLTEIVLRNDRRAVGISTDEPQRLQGMHCENTLIIVDEANGVEMPIFDALKGMLTSENAKLLMIGNPITPEGYFFESHQPGAPFKQLKMSVLDSPNVKTGKIVIPGLTTQEWVDEVRDEFGEENPYYIARVLGEFPESSVDTLIPRGWAQAALERGKAWNGNPPKVDKESLRLGCDVARFGADSTVTIIADDYGVRDMDVRKGADLMETVGRVRMMVEKWGIEEEAIAIDDTGLGGGPTDRLHELNIGVFPVDFGQRALNPERFVNKRTEMYWMMREALNPKKDAVFAIPPKYRQLVNEIIQPRYKFRSTSQRELEKKDDIKKRLGKSPDRADALALCFAPRAPSMRIERL